MALTVEEVQEIREEIEPLSNEQLVLKALSGILSQIKNNTYYSVVASVLRERSEEENK